MPNRNSVATKTENSRVSGVSFRFRLWMLFPLFIPAAIYALNLRSQMMEEYYYTESAEEFLEKDHAFLAVKSSKETLVPDQELMSEFSDQGVSFSFGFPDNFPIFQDPSVQPRDPNKFFVGISGYPLKLNGESKATLSCIKRGRRYNSKFRGPMVIAFHKPNRREKIDGAHRVGFYLTRIDNPGDAQISLYSTNGRLMHQFTNTTSGTVFMGVESIQPIGWLEIKMTGKDNNYALGELSFSKKKITSTSSSSQPTQ